MFSDDPERQMTLVFILITLAISAMTERFEVWRSRDGGVSWERAS